jgi:2,5-diamino-6-(ribosylamino)-4(3H)-pyrimidinone 5'-phosphate reductase
MRERTFNTLFMLSSVDGKISTGGSDKRDVDKDFPKIKGIKEGLKQYYELEKRTSIHSLNTGRVMAKIGVNTDKCPINCPTVNFIIIDNNHLNKKGVDNLINRTKKLFLVTSNKNHPAFQVKDKLELLYYPKKVDFKDLFKKLRKKYKASRVTIQSGGTLNAVFIREGLIDRLSLVVAPGLIGGKDTSSLVDGKSLHSEKDLKNIKALKLRKCDKLKNSYLHLVYDVL